MLICCGTAEVLLGVLATYNYLARGRHATRVHGTVLWRVVYQPGSESETGVGVAVAVQLQLQLQLQRRADRAAFIVCNGLPVQACHTARLGTEKRAFKAVVPDAASRK